MSELSFPLVAGRFVRRPILHELKASAIRAGITLDIDEDKGLIESYVIVRATGDSDTLVAWNRAVRAYFARIEADA